MSSKKLRYGNTTSSLHVVRHFGPVGGMENYVWELTHALIRANQHVQVICERYKGGANHAIEVIELGQLRPNKPGWIAQLRFSGKVSHYIHSKGLQNEVIHSHERTAIHHVTTFHSPPFFLRKKKVLDFLSPRIHARTYLERRELTGKQVRVVLPNSDLIGNQLRNFYPQAAHKIGAPAYPGVAPSFSSIIKSDSNGKTIGFLGREWKRKGLDIAVEIVKCMRQQDPEITFLVAGCDQSKIKYLFKDWKEGYELLDWVKPEDFMAKIDLLIHPARIEPFGMVIAEANAVGIPVVVSDQCGIASILNERQGKVIPIENRNEWVEACQKLLENKQSVEPLHLSWKDLAIEHITLYNRLT